MPYVVCEQCGKVFQVKAFFFGKAKYCSKACKDAARKTLAPIICKGCGKEFMPITATVTFCDKPCRYAHQAGITREEWIAAHPPLEANRLFKRVCHDCGKPTNDYRCSDCWAKLRRETELSGIPEHEVHGKAEGHAWLG